MLEFLEPHMEMIKTVGGILFIVMIIAMIVLSIKDHGRQIEAFSQKYGFKCDDKHPLCAEIDDIIKNSARFSKKWLAGVPYLIGDGEAVFILSMTSSNSASRDMLAYWSRTRNPDVVFRGTFFGKQDIVIEGLEAYYISARDEAAARLTAGKIKDFLLRHPEEYELEITGGNLIVAMDGQLKSAEQYEALLLAGREIRTLLR